MHNSRKFLAASMLNFNLPSVDVEGAVENLLELPAEGEVDEEVGGGVDHQGELVQAGQAEEPGRRVEVRAASEK